MSDIFEQLESNDKETFENVMLCLREQFSKVQDRWLLDGLYDYYLRTNSIRIVNVLVPLREPHNQYLFDRLLDSIKSTNSEIKVQALTLLGHVVRSEPTWLYKIADHSLLTELLVLLKNEGELLPLISALLLLIVLLPMIPSSMGKFLKEIFDIFSRLASWNCSPGPMVEDQIIHLQIALYALFLRLYGMYPCNFLGYLRTNYKENNPVFTHTIKPMLDTVRMHPALVTSSKESETTTERWKKMGVHDVIVECERFSLDLSDRCPHDTCQSASGYRSRSGTTNSTIEPSYQIRSLRNLPSAQSSIDMGPNFFAPSRAFSVATPPVTESMDQGLQFPSTLQASSSPPEAAIEATPETTPVRDYSRVLTPVRATQLSANVPRALLSFRGGGSGSNTPGHSQPSSPMRKESSPFTFVTESAMTALIIKQQSHSNQKMLALKRERSQAFETFPEPVSKAKPPPSSPLRIINPETTRVQRTESPVSQEDEEVLSIVNNSQTTTKQPPGRPCDSGLPDFDDSPENVNHEQGSPCTAGGLHMPNSRSMSSFAKRVRRLRYHSQCGPDTVDPTRASTGSSPGDAVSFPNGTTVRRANSCPEMEKAPPMHCKDNKKKPFYETDEETVSEDQVESISNASNGIDGVKCKNKKSESCSVETQTENFFPMPYEHLFLGTFPSLEGAEVRPSPAPSPAPVNAVQDKNIQPSIYELLDKYMESAVVHNDTKSIQSHLQLVYQQLLFERHRRETHAYRNRRLLSDAKSTRLLEECNSALRDRVQLQQKDIDDLQHRLNTFRRERLEEEKKLNRTIEYWEEQFKKLKEECQKCNEAKERAEKEFHEKGEICKALDRERQAAQALLVEAYAEVKVARDQALGCEKVKGQLDEVNKQMVLMGEIQIKYKERLERLNAISQVEDELEYLRDAYKMEVRSLHNQLESKIGLLEVHRTRILELEHIIQSKEDVVSVQKRLLSGLNEEHHEKIEAVESKYQTQLTINRALEEKILELRSNLENAGRRAVGSPDTSSCQEVNVTTTMPGFSPHSSPLSASLASSEGSAAFGQEREARHLQAFMDHPDNMAGPSKIKRDNSGDGDKGNATAS